MATGKVMVSTTDQSPPPTPVDLANIGHDYKALYTCQKLPGKPLCGLVSYVIPDTIPDNAEIGTAVQMLRNGFAPSASSMKVEELKEWHATHEMTPTPWWLVIELVQHAFQTGVVPMRARSNTLVLIPKPEPGQVQGIGLLEPIWKLILAIINLQLMKHVKFHDSLHSF